MIPIINTNHPKAGFNFAHQFFGYLSSDKHPKKAIAEMINNNL
jgi:hypothetical protein